jgi:serine/threonine protein kinase
LNTNERQYSADIFSFGIVLYELIQICASQGLKENNVLPSDGTLWQKLRSGDFILPDNVPLSMALLVRAMMNPSPASRPSASDILTLPEVSLIEKDPSLYADEWKDICFVQPRSMNRTASYDPATMRI